MIGLLPAPTFGHAAEAFVVAHEAPGAWAKGTAVKSPALTSPTHDRLRPGMNHLAFHAGTRHHVDILAAEGPAHDWMLLFPDKHPHAGGPDHYVAYLTNTDGFEVELVATKHDQLNT